jgi:hypothetical protein
MSSTKWSPWIPIWSLVFYNQSLEGALQWRDTKSHHIPLFNWVYCTISRITRWLDQYVPALTTALHRYKQKNYPAPIQTKYVHLKWHYFAFLFFCTGAADDPHVSNLDRTRCLAGCEEILYLRPGRLRWRVATVGPLVGFWPKPDRSVWSCGRNYWNL